MIEIATCKLPNLAKITLILVLSLIFVNCAVKKEGKLSVDSDEGASFELTFKRSKEHFEIMTVKQLVEKADIIAKVKTVRNIPVAYEANNVRYSQLATVKVQEVLKGDVSSEVVKIYAKNQTLPLNLQASFEIYDELLVFLAKEGKHYTTLNDYYGQMPIYDTLLTNWRKEKDGEILLDIHIPYKQAKQQIISILSS